MAPDGTLAPGMGTVNLDYAAKLRDDLGLTRAVESGTLRGDTAQALAGIFPTVVTVELSHEWHRRASERLAGTSIRLLHGHSVDHLLALAGERIPTLYYLDGHWSAGDTAGVEDECPVLEEIRAIGSGHPDDCLIIDDARYFLAAPPPPLDVAQWPTIIEVLDTLREQRPDHALTILADQVIAVPQHAKPVTDRYAWSIEPPLPLRSRLINAASRARHAGADLFRTRA